MIRKRERFQLTRSGNNGLAIPTTSTKIDATMKFLDWMFGSQEAHDLIQYGIEGTDFAYGEEEGTVDVLSVTILSLVDMA